MLRRVQSVLLSILILGGLPSQAHAQTVPAPLFGVGGMVHLEGGSADPPYLIGPLSGTAPAVDIVAGVTLFRPLAVALEASIARSFTADPQATRTSVYQRTHRDTMFSGVLRVSLGNRLAAVGGVTRVRIETDQVLIEGLRGPYMARHRAWSTGLVLGLDYTVLQWRAIALVPAARVFVFDHHDPYGDLPPHFGYGSRVVRLGVRAETRF